MPPLPGEERLLTLFADVHYYFQKPTNRPLKHRFDKASYFYLYYNSTRQTSRIEIANDPGTQDQDAVHGYIDKSRVTNTQKFPTRISIEIEVEELSASPTSPVTKDLDEWRLPSGDVRDTSREKLKIHTIDVYLWAQEDARLAVDFFSKLLTPAQLDIGIATQKQTVRSASQQDNVSSVVKNLEQIAVTDPAYQNGQTRNLQSQPQAIPIKLPPPPPPPNTSQSRSAARSQSSSTTSATAQRVASSASQKSEPATTYAPMAYNPAAPAAPEPIAHREKTPPPPDEGSAGTGLQHAVHDQSHLSQQAQYSHFGSPPPPSTYGSPPPPSATSGYLSQSSSLAHMSPPSHAQQMRSSTTSTAPSFAPPPTTVPQTDVARKHSTAAETYTPSQPSSGQQDAETPNEQFYSTLPQDKRPLQHVQPRYQTEYFHPTSSAAYPQHTQSPPQNEYDIHSSVYRPTEAEASAHKHHHKPTKPTSPKQDAGSLKGLAKRFTTGVNKTISKAESKYL